MPRRILEGNVVSSKNDKTITVLVERRYMHPVYKKYIKSSDKYTAHDEANQYKEGDRVSIIECRPLSKRKRWTVVAADESVKVEGVKKKEGGKSKKKVASPKKEQSATKKSVETKKKSTAKKSTAKKKDA